MTDSLLLGRFRVGEQIGQGGMSRVYRAIDEWTGAVVAVKVLREDLGADEDFARRFEREAQAAEAMSHENIVSLIDVGEQDGHRFLVMEHVAGVTLKALIRDYGRLGPEHAVAIAVQVCRALQHAHGQKIVHRDIKPQNILVQEDGMIKVADFGIARALNADTMTATDLGVLGSVHYVSPEQARGGWTDEKSDLYSLGVVLYEMVVGHPPFEGEAPYAIALAHMQDDPVPPLSIYPDIPLAIQEIILRAMEKDKVWRYDEAEEMERDLLKALKCPGGGFVYKKPVHHDDAPTRQLPVVKGDGLVALEAAPPRRRRIRWAALILGGLVLVGIVLLGGSAIGLEWFSRTITVPPLTGLSDAEAEAVLLELGLEPLFIDEHTLEAEAGYVFRQTPVNGKRVSEGGLVQVTVSAGPAEVMVIDFQGMTEEEARTAIEGVDLVVGEVHVDYDSPTVPKGRVSKQEPKPTEIVLAGEAIDLWVSDPELNRPVPDVVNLSREDAIATLEKNGFRLGTETQRTGSNFTPGIVVQQSPAKDEIVPVGAAIDIVISMHPYRKAWEATVNLPHGGMRVAVRYQDGDGYRERDMGVYPTGGEKNIGHTFEFDQPGTYTLELLIDGKVERSEQIFVEERASTP